MSERSIESYFIYPSEYDRSQASPIEGYVHPEPNFNLDFTDYGATRDRLSGKSILEIKELIIQSIANWPQADHENLISDRANIHSIDVWSNLKELANEGYIEENLTFDPETLSSGAEYNL